MTRPSSLLTHLARQSLGVTLALGLAVAPLPAIAAQPPADEKAEGEGEAAPADATVGGNVALLKFEGGANAETWRGKIKEALEGQGYVANGIKRSMQEAADRNKCKSINDKCREKVAAYLNKNSKTAYDFYVYAEIPDSGQGAIVIWDIAQNKVAAEIEILVAEQDYILAEVIAPTVAQRLAHYQVPPAEATAEEKEILAALDEPEKTPEELAAEQAEIEQAEQDALDAFRAGVDVGEQAVDLKNDFKDFCRTGPREDKEVQKPDGTVEKERDLRPACKRGPVFGYWQPRAWVALTLTIGSGITMGVMYGMAAAARSEWSDAKDTLDASGLSATNPNQSCDADGTCYEDLAGQVSEASSKIRRRAIIGDVFLGSTVLLAGVLAIIIYQDRSAAKGYISREKELRALSNLRVAPMLGEQNGAAISFDF